MPRGVVHRLRISSPLEGILFELRGGLHLPREFRNPVGQLRMDAPYTHRDFARPAFKGPRPGPTRILVKKDDAFVERFPAASPFDVVGWDGTVWPFAFDILKYQAKTGLVHLPPTIHSTFAGRNALVCSFVPRVTDTHPDAIPCPYPHASVDCDEVIYYVRGNFTSRKGVGPKAVSLHPAGVPHGPHPGAYEGSIGSRSTDELAVMMDTFAPLRLTRAGARAGVARVPRELDTGLRSQGRPETRGPRARVQATDTRFRRNDEGTPRHLRLALAARFSGHTRPRREAPVPLRRRPRRRSPSTTASSRTA